MATRELEPGAGSGADDLERELVFLGLVGLQDPPRPDVAHAVLEAREAGIAIVMITGDYGLTAEAIARKIGIVTTPHPDVVTGAELERIDDDALAARLAEVRDGRELLFARVAPADKLRVVDAFKSLDEIVAVTGDGVNDAPALKRADIGVAMGVAGTDVAKEAAVMVLLDDSFATIVKAIERGRAVYNNIRRFLVYLFTHNIGELFPIVFATLAGLPVVPLNALQVLSIDLGSDVLPALALGAEEPEPGLLKQPPRPRTERLLSRGVIGRFVFLGLIQAVGATASFYFALYEGGWRWGDPLSSSDAHLPPGDHDDPGRDRLLAGLQRLRRAHRSAQRVLDRDLLQPPPGRRPGPRRGHHARHLIRSSLAERVRHRGAARLLLGRPGGLRRRRPARRGAAQALRAPADSGREDGLAMRVIVLGCGRLGSSVANMLDGEGHQVAVIDRDAATMDKLRPGFAGEQIVGYGYDRHVLEQARLERADAFVAATAGDNRNIVAALAARRRFRVPIVVARIYDPDRAEIFRGPGDQDRLAGPVVGRDDPRRPAAPGDRDRDRVRQRRGRADPRRRCRRTSRAARSRTSPSPGDIAVAVIERGGRAILPTLGVRFEHDDVVRFVVAREAYGRFESFLGMRG